MSYTVWLFGWSVFNFFHWMTSNWCYIHTISLRFFCISYCFMLEWKTAPHDWRQHQAYISPSTSGTCGRTVSCRVTLTSLWRVTGRWRWAGEARASPWPCAGCGAAPVVARTRSSVTPSRIRGGWGVGSRGRRCSRNDWRGRMWRR